MVGINQTGGYKNEEPRRGRTFQTASWAASKLVTYMFYLLAGMCSRFLEQPTSLSTPHSPQPILKFDTFNKRGLPLLSDPPSLSFSSLRKASFAEDFRDLWHNLVSQGLSDFRMISGRYPPPRDINSNTTIGTHLFHLCLTPTLNFSS